MINDATGNRRLLKLAEFLRALPRKRFDYSTWVGEDWKGAPDLSCGTTACALGWATVVPSIRRAGLRLVSVKAKTRGGEEVVSVANPQLGIMPDEDGPYDLSFSAAISVFGISLDDAMFLFQPGHERYREDGSVNRSPDHKATPKQVASHIEKFVKARERAALAG